MFPDTPKVEQAYNSIKISDLMALDVRAQSRSDVQWRDGFQSELLRGRFNKLLVILEALVVCLSAKAPVCVAEDCARNPIEILGHAAISDAI